MSTIPMTDLSAHPRDRSGSREGRRDDSVEDGETNPNHSSGYGSSEGSSSGFASAEEGHEGRGLRDSSEDPGQDFHVNVRTLTGQTIPIQFRMIPGETRVGVIKDAVEESEDLPAELQRLIFGGREVQNQEFVSDLHLESGDTVHMLLRQNQQAQADLEQGIYLPDNPPPGAVPGDGGVRGAPGGIRVDGDDDRANRLMRTMQLSRAVRIFAVIDGFFLVLSAFSIWPLAVGVLLAICGYHGASQFRSGLTMCYLVYLVLATALRGYWFGMSIDDEQYFVSIILLMSVLIEIYIFYIVWKFLKLLRRSTERDRMEMMEIINGPAV